MKIPTCAYRGSWRGLCALEDGVLVTGEEAGEGDGAGDFESGLLGDLLDVVSR